MHDATRERTPNALFVSSLRFSWSDPFFYSTLPLPLPLPDEDDDDDDASEASTLSLTASGGLGAAGSRTMSLDLIRNEAMVRERPELARTVVTRRAELIRLRIVALSS